MVVGVGEGVGLGGPGTWLGVGVFGPGVGLGVGVAGPVVGVGVLGPEVGTGVGPCGPTVGRGVGVRSGDLVAVGGVPEVPGVPGVPLSVAVSVRVGLLFTGFGTMSGPTTRPPGHWGTSGAAEDSESRTARQTGAAAWLIQSMAYGLSRNSEPAVL